jgi:hypothetical protein
MLQIYDMDRWLYCPSEGRHAEDFNGRKIQRLRPGLNPQTWVPEASMLTTRPPNKIWDLNRDEVIGDAEYDIMMGLIVITLFF